MTTRIASSYALAQAARSMRMALILHGVVRWVVLSGGGVLVLLLLDELLHLPQALRLPLAVVLVGFILVDFYRRVWRPIRRPLSPARAARMLEVDRHIAGNLLINAHHFQRQEVDANWRPFVGSILASSSSALSNIPGGSLWLTGTLKKWFLGLFVIAVGWVLVVFAYPRYVTTGMERIFLPLADIPPIGSWSIDVTPSSEVHVVEGDRLDVTALLKSQLGLSGKPPIPHIVWQDGASSSESAAGERATMVPLSRRNRRLEQRVGRCRGLGTAATQGIELRRHAACLHWPETFFPARTARGARSSGRLNREGAGRTGAELARRDVAHGKGNDSAHREWHWLGAHPHHHRFGRL
jgi:hypothetical protein